MFDTVKRRAKHPPGPKQACASRSPMSNTRKVALVTGGASGIGREICIELSQQGVLVVVADVDKAGANDTLQQLTDVGGSVDAHTHSMVNADVSKEDEVKQLLDNIRSRYGRLDYCFNNAGIEGESAPTADYSTEGFDKVMAVNARGVFLCLKYQIPLLLDTAEGQGSIVITSSVAGVGSVPGVCGYAAAKHAVVGMMRTAAAEYGPKGMRINCINPGGIDTPLLQRFASKLPGGKDEVYNALVSGYPLGRLGTAKEIAAAAVFVGTKATFMTGQTLVLDGGGFCR